MERLLRDPDDEPMMTISIKVLKNGDIEMSSIMPPQYDADAATKLVKITLKRIVAQAFYDGAPPPIKRTDKAH